MPGTRSSGISTPRSPRATISASATAMISSMRWTACGFSILAITSARPLAISLTSTMSSGRWTNESAIQSMFSSSAAARSARSLSVMAEVGNGRVGQAHALLVWIRPGDLDDGRSAAGRGLDDAQHAACRRRSGCGGPGRASSEFPDAAGRRARIRRATDRCRGRRCRPCAGPRRRRRRRRASSFGPWRSTRTPIGRPVSSSSARIIATRSRMTSCEAWLMLMRKTSAPAANRAARVSRSREAGPRVAMILTRRGDGPAMAFLHHRRSLPPARCSTRRGSRA